jgi:hypothetical protein
MALVRENMMALAYTYPLQRKKIFFEDVNQNREAKRKEYPIQFESIKNKYYLISLV